MPVVLRALRGATTLDADTKEQVSSRTQALVRAMLDDNAVDPDDIVSIVFSTTNDVTAGFPATAARLLGLDQVALIDVSQLAVPGDLPRCVRVLLTCYSGRARHELVHVFLEGASDLRPDLKR